MKTTKGKHTSTGEVCFPIVVVLERVCIQVCLWGCLPFLQGRDLLTETMNVVVLLTTLALLLVAVCVEPTPVDFLQRINSKQEQASPHRAACPKKCQPELCPSSHLLQRCPAGRAKDSCGCCWECGNAEGQFCDVDPSAGLYGRCAEGLKCRVPPKQKSHFLSGEERKEEVEEAPRPVCVCARQDVLCATDGNTYENKCQLRSAQHNMAPGQDKPTLAHYGPCRSRECFFSSPSWGRG